MKTFDDIADTSKQLLKIVEKSAELSTFDLANEFLTDSNEYAPMVTGDLKRSGIKHSNLKEGLIVWQTPYARRLFYNPQYNFSTDANPNAQGLWAEKAKAVNKNKYDGIGGESFKEAKKDVINNVK